MIGRSRSERLERGAPLGEHLDERCVVAHLAVGGGLELGERGTPARSIERDHRVGAKGRPDAKRRFDSGECAVLRERGACGIGRRQALDPKPVEQRPRGEHRRCQLLFNARVDRACRRRVELLLDPEHRCERLAQPKPGRRQREQVNVVGEQLPDGAIVDVGSAEAAAFERHALRVEHPHDVVVGGDEETARRIEPCGGVSEEPHVDVPVGTHDRQVGDAAVQVDADRRALDVTVGAQIRHSPRPGLGMSTVSGGNCSFASPAAR